MEGFVSSRGSGWPDFRRLWIATASTNVADGMLLAAVPLIALSLTRDPLLITCVTVAQYIPWLLFSFPAGVLADRRDRTQLMRMANLIRVAALTSFAVAALLGEITLPLLFSLVLVMGVAETLYDNTSSAIVPNVVDDSLLEKANGRLQSTYTLANSFAGPPLGGILFGLAISAPLFVGALGYVLAIFLLLRIPAIRAVGSDEIGAAVSGFVAPMQEGWRIFRSSPILVSLCTLAGVGNAVSAGAYALIPLVLVESIGAPASSFGLVLAGGALGAAIGGAFGDKLAALLPPGFVLIGTTIFSGFVVATLAVAPNPIILSALMAVDGFLIMAQSVVLMSTRARLIPNGALGRVTAVFRSFSLGAAVIGALIGGIVARYAETSFVFIGGGVVLLLVSGCLAQALRTSRLNQEMSMIRHVVKEAE